MRCPFHWTIVTSIDAPARVECPVLMREPGTDKEWSDVRMRGQMPTRYPTTSAA